MKIRSKMIYVNVMIAVFFILVVSNIYIYGLKEIEKGKRISLERNLETFQKTEALLARNLKRTRDLQIKLESQLSQAITIKRDLLAKLEEKDTAVQELKDLMSKKEKMLALTTDEVKGKDVQIQELNARLEQERFAVSQLTDELSEVTTRYNIALDRQDLLKKKISSLKSQDSGAVELDKIVIKSMPNLSGKVLNVNEDFGFVVVNVGRRDNVDIGTVFSVYRDEKEVGKIQIEEVRDQISAATILPETDMLDIKIDDVVREL